MRYKDQPQKKAAPAIKGKLHPRNRHQGRYDFAKLIKACPELAPFVIINPYGKESLDFADPKAVRVFNRALLKQLYGIAHWDIPEGYLCPPVPGRADYIHGLADLLAQSTGGEIPRGPQVRALDIGTGANCIYPLLGHSDYAWQFVGADIDEAALACARTIISSNALTGAIELRQQAKPDQIFQDLIGADERFTLTLCNPPFHSSAEEAASGSTRKWKNLGKLDPKRKLPALNFGGQSNELWCEGGEIAFLRRMAKESSRFASQVLWFTSLVSKASNLPPLQQALKQAGTVQVQQHDMAQGNKQSRFIAWTFHSVEQRRAWFKAQA